MCHCAMAQGFLNIELNWVFFQFSDQSMTLLLGQNVFKVWIIAMRIMDLTKESSMYFVKYHGSIMHSSVETQSLLNVTVYFCLFIL